MCEYPYNHGGLLDGGDDLQGAATLRAMLGGAEDTVQKLVELLSVAVPKLKRIAVITNPASSSHPAQLLRIEAAARQTGKQALPVGARTPDEIERGFATMARERIDAVIILSDAFLFQQRTQIAGLALKRRLPSIYGSAGYAEVGGLMNYGSGRREAPRDCLPLCSPAAQQDVSRQ